MEERSLYPYVYFGTTLWFLTTVESGRLVNARGSVTDNLREFLRKLDELGLIVTEGIASQSGLPGLLSDFEASDDQRELTTEEADQVNDAVRGLRSAIDAELGTKSAYVVAPKRWDTEKLLHEPSALFDPRTFPALEDLPRTDFEEACKCIAFERATAAAFHLMRGTEAVLRSFYCFTVKQKRLSLEKRMWGPMVEALRKRRRPPPAALLDELDNIRTNYRNPTQHPDAAYDIHRAQDLLGVSIAVVNQMVAEMASPS